MAVIKQVNLSDQMRERLVADLVAFTSEGLKPLNTLCRAAALSLGYDRVSVTVRLGTTVFFIGRYGVDVKQFDVVEGASVLAPSRDINDIVESFEPDKAYPAVHSKGHTLPDNAYWLAVPIEIDGMLIGRFNLADSRPRSEPASDLTKGIAKDFAAVAGTIVNGHRLLKQHVRQTFEALEALNE